MDVCVLRAADLPQVALHGTGTPLGDPIETGALGQALSARGAPFQPAVAIAAVKSCYGHTEGAAGLTGPRHAASDASKCPADFHVTLLCKPHI